MCTAQQSRCQRDVVLYTSAVHLVVSGLGNLLANNIVTATCLFDMCSLIILR